jgi:hypothetical protein
LDAWHTENRTHARHFYLHETMVSLPQKLGFPLLFNLDTNPREDSEKTTDSRAVGSALKNDSTHSSRASCSTQ